MENYTLSSATHIGHANLKVADLERALSFYRDILGFRVRATPRGGEMVVLGASERSLDLALMALDLSSSRSLPTPPSRLQDRKNTRLNSSHQIISYAVLCLQ